MVKNAHTLDYIHVHGANMISANLVLSYAVARYPRFYRTNTKTRRCHVRYLCGPSKMWGMTSAPYRLHSHLKMALEQKNKMLKVSGKQWPLSPNKRFRMEKNTLDIRMCQSIHPTNQPINKATQ